MTYFEKLLISQDIIKNQSHRLADMSTVFTLIYERRIIEKRKFKTSFADYVMKKKINRNHPRMLNFLLVPVVQLIQLSDHCKQVHDVVCRRSFPFISNEFR